MPSLGTTKQTLRLLARRYRALTTEIKELDTQINRLCARVNPALLAASGVGTDTAAALLVAAGDNPERMQVGSVLRRSVRRQYPSKHRRVGPCGTGSTTHTCKGSLGRGRV